MHRPIWRGDRVHLRGVFLRGTSKERGKRPRGLLTTAQPTAVDNGREHACGGIQGCERKPVWLCHRRGQEPVHFSTSNPYDDPASPQCAQELIRLGSCAPGSRRKG